MHSNYSLVVTLAPALAALLTALPRRFVSERNFKIGWLFLIASFAASLPVLWQAILSTEPSRVTLFASHFSVLPLVELNIDRLSAVMMVVVSGIGMLIYRYSIRYLQQDPGHPRFQTLLALSISTLLFMVSSADLITLFITWQLLSWFLCLLSHNFAHTPTAQSCFRTFIMLRAGDIAFLSGIALAYHLYGTVQFGPLFELAAADQTRFNLFGTGIEMTGATAVTLLIFVGAMSKSAQFPLHMWLPDSLYAPTPIHALLHAGIINAGGFLLNRLAPLYALSPATLHVVLAVGLLTMLFGKCMMLLKNDIKKTLGYSTIGQMGYMIMECGLGAFSLAIFHLIAHGLFKATVFLNCGDVIHKARLEPDSPPQPEADGEPGVLAWVTGFLVSLVLPLIIIIGAHFALGIAILPPQGTLVFLLFSWVTAAHAMLTVFRLRKGWPTMTGMLALIALISTVYFLAAEQFTHFLYPAAGVVDSYFQAAALPGWVFLLIASILFASIAISWFMLYLHYHDKVAIRKGRLWAQIYLFFMNRLYLDGLALRLFDALKRAGRTLDRSKAAFPIIALLALVFAWKNTPHLTVDWIETAPILLLSSLLLPLFPFHGLYVSALTRAPRTLAVLLSVLLPFLGVLLIPKLPSEILPLVGTLAGFGALWGSTKALIQNRVPSLLAYAGVALYSVLWWHIATAGNPTAYSLMYAWAVTLAIGGLCFAWDRVTARYGDLDLNKIGGLFSPMPRFSLCVSLLIMAAAGLPPFSLFFGYLGMLLNPSTAMSLGHVAIIAAWFAASWYLFKLMQRLLFGPSRADLKYEDLRPAEVALFVVVLALLVAPGTIPPQLLEAGITEVTWINGGSL